MIESFSSAFSGTLEAMAAIFLVVVVAGLLVRRGVIGQKQIDGLSTATVAEGDLYVIKSEVTRNAIGAPLQLPFEFFRVDLQSFEAPD